MTQANVLVCGTVYGASYLRAITHFSPSTRLAGILGRGGQSSQAAAKQYSMPLYTSPEQALEHGSIDLACVAVGGASGIELAHRFLKRGISVVQEHPLPCAEVTKLQAAAKETATAWHLNAHFADLPVIQPFVEGCRKLVQTSKPLFINAFVNPRTLFSALDILARALPHFGNSDWTKLPQIHPQSDFHTTIYGELSGAVATLQSQRTVSAVDDGSSTLVSHHIEVGFEQGVLELCDTFGPVAWRPNPATLFSAQVSNGTPPELWNLFPGSKAPSQQGFQTQRDQANGKALEQLRAHALTGQAPPEQAPAHQQMVSAMWDRMVELFGPPITVPVV